MVKAPIFNTELTNAAKLSIYKKSASSGIDTGILEQVYCRGYISWNPMNGGSPEQCGFSRLNSFVSNGEARSLDADLLEFLDKPTPSIATLAKKHHLPPGQVSSLVKKGAKVEGEHTNNKGVASEIARDHVNERPDYYKRLAKVEEKFETSETQSSNAAHSSSRFDGTGSLVDLYKKSTPGQVIKRTVRGNK